jgi:tryptophanyl-tRNA synthetase
MNKRLLSGVKPSGRPHLGNYLGAMRQFVELAKTHESFVFVADYHALNTVHDGAVLRQNTIDVVLDYLAIGLDPERTVLFKQSDLPEHTELCWIFNTLTTMPYLMRAHAFKDAEAKNKDINVGTFDYPMLMAADILLYEPDIVPVGADQKQHVEFARDTAEKFNRTYGETFRLPNAYIPEEVAVIPGIDGQKMSKSYGNTIPLFADDDEIRKLAMSIVTDSKGVVEPKDPDTCNVFALHKHFSREQLPELTRRYVEGGIGYKESKEILAENLVDFVTPLRERRHELAKDPDQVHAILFEGATKARVLVQTKMREVREKIGVSIS